MFTDSNWDVLQNPNVKRILIFSFIDGSCLSLWSSQVFPVLVNKLSGDTTVGWLSAASGIAQMLAALAVGFAANMKRETVLRFGALSGICAVCLTLFGVATLKVPLFFFSSTLWGMYNGIVATGTEALFADSVVNGKRDFVYNLKWINQTLCDCIGSLTSLLMLLHLGNEWSLGSLRTVMFFGLVLHPIAQLLLLTMKDKYALEEHSHTSSGVQCVTIFSGDEAVSTDQTVCKGAQNPKGSEFSLMDENSDSSMTLTANMPASPSTQRESVVMELSMQSTARREQYLAAQEGRNGVAWVVAAIGHYICCMFEWESVPYLVCLVDFLISFGSGMTVRYIPLFFVNDHGVSPAALMSTYIAISFVQALLASLLRYAGERYINRVAAVVIIRVLGALLLMIMGLTDLHFALLLPIFILRSAAMNSTQGVTRSVIMDCVKKESRAKWSAFESFSSFTWAGSAVIGGYIAEAKGYKFTFIITAVIHLIALLVLCPAIHGSQEVDRIHRHQLKLEREERKNKVVVEDLEVVRPDGEVRVAE